MKAIKLTLLILLMLFMHQALAQNSPQHSPQVHAEKLDAIREVLKTTGSLNLGKQVLLRMSESLKVGRSEIEQEKIDRLIAKMDPSELVEEIVKIYDRHFSLDEIQGILAFYKSPVGQKYVAELPALLSEAMTLGQTWGQSKTNELKRELEAEQTTDSGLVQ